MTGDAVEKIGNNVTLEFDNMDFGEEGFKKLVICGRSRNDVNTVHIHFVSEEEISSRSSKYHIRMNILSMNSALKASRG